MKRWFVVVVAALASLTALDSDAADAALIVPSGPSVAVTGAATTSVPNDRMQATVRAEADHASAAQAASEVNARMAKALARAKAAPGIDARSAGYSTWQMWEKGKPSRWKAVQSLQLTSTDFSALAAVITRLQEEDGLVVSGMTFSVSPDMRRKAEDALTREAIRVWQQRAATAADALGYANWRAGRLNVTTGDAAPPPRPEMMMRAQAAPTGAPVVVEGGTTELTVTVSGDAVLDKPR
ncbi:MAG TPA: SIMPL domain-containing protein [Casimicrobiaceae bacterium]|nr:SIMPL domain-containing protein [Casimicrobiaceae bacterium]